MKIAAYRCMKPPCDAFGQEIHRSADDERPQLCNTCGYLMDWIRNEELTRSIPRVLAIRDNINMRINRVLHIAAGVTLGEIMDGFYEMSDAMPTLVGALERAEEFIRGFEDDEMQRGMKQLLSDIRAAIKLGKALDEQPRSNTR